MSMTYSTDREPGIFEETLPPREAETRRAPARRKARAGKPIKTWMILAPLGAIVLVGSGALMLQGGDNTTAALTAEPAATAPTPATSLAAPVAPTATETTPAPIPAAPVETSPAPVQRAASQTRAAAPAAAAAETPVEPVGPRPYAAEAPPTAALNAPPASAAPPPPAITTQPLI
ncbi:hypothetical protein E4M02_13020 [Brevundimonas sp. S30B]|uniref:hypothetical protein n=2 Tax=unclassified Brevundimonas TaxID=2622653 RepID=UPI0010723C23|nr:hypothetical protein [Brevundimonas sp. S30B]TFW00869.1 hypothetical protein E4M02_13020 [Brevundimonas sp. S30B]